MTSVIRNADGAVMPEPPGRRPAQRPAVRAHRVQVQEEVAEDERRAAAVGVRRAAAEGGVAQIAAGAAQVRARSAAAPGVGRRRRQRRSSCDSPSCPAGTVERLRRRCRCPPPPALTASQGSAFGAGPCAPSRRARSASRGTGTRSPRPSASRCSRGACRRATRRRRPSASRKIATERPGGTKACAGRQRSRQRRRLNLRDGDGSTAALRQPRMRRRREEQRAGRRPQRRQAEEVAARHRLGFEARAGLRRCGLVMRPPGRRELHALHGDRVRPGSAWRTARSGCSGPRPSGSRSWLARSASGPSARVDGRVESRRRLEVVERHQLEARASGRRRRSRRTARSACRRTPASRRSRGSATPRGAPSLSRVADLDRASRIGEPLARRSASAGRRAGSPRSRARGGSARARGCAPRPLPARCVRPVTCRYTDARRLLAGGHRVDQQPRAVRQVAGDEDAGRRGRQRLRIDLRPAGPELLDVGRRRRRGTTRSGVWPGGDQHRVARDRRRARASSKTGLKRRLLVVDAQAAAEHDAGDRAAVVAQDLDRPPAVAAARRPSSSPSRISTVSAGISSSVSSDTRRTRRVPGRRAAVRAAS